MKTRKIQIKTKGVKSNRWERTEATRKWIKRNRMRMKKRIKRKRRDTEITRIQTIT